MSADNQMNPGHVCRDYVPGLSPKGHSVWVVGWCRSLSSSTFLHPFAPPELPGFVATMDALTPERRLFLPVGSPAGIRHMNTVLSVQVSLFHVSGLPSILSPTTPPSPPSLSHTTPQRSGLLFPVLSRRARNSRKSLGFAIHTPAHRADRPKRVRILRAAHSPPVAPHPASRRRSYSQLQAGVCLPEEDLHLSGQIRLQTHVCRPSGACGL